MKKVKDIIYKSNNSIYDSIEPKLYTREEVESLLRTALFKAAPDYANEVDDWIKENLK